MPRFNPGDQVTIKGEEAEIMSWPHSEEGAFSYKTKGRNGSEVRHTGYVSSVVVARRLQGVPANEGGDGAPLANRIDPATIELTKAAPPPPAPKPLPADVLRELEREEAELAKEREAKAAEEKAALRAELRAELLEELKSLGLAPVAPAEVIEPEAVNREAHEGDVVATKPELVIADERPIDDEEYDSDYADLQSEFAAARTAPLDEEQDVPADTLPSAQPWGRGGRGKR